MAFTQSGRLGNAARATSVHPRGDGVAGGCGRGDSRGLRKHRLLTRPVLGRWRSPVRFAVLFAAALLAIAMFPGVAASAVTSEPMPIPLPIAGDSGDDPGELCRQPPNEPLLIDVEPAPIPVEPIPDGDEIQQPLPILLGGTSGDDPGETGCRQRSNKPPPIDAELPLEGGGSDEIQPFLGLDNVFEEIGEIGDLVGEIGDFLGEVGKFVKEVGGFVWKVGETLWKVPISVFNGLVELCGILTEGESESYSESDLDAGQCVNDFLGLIPVLGIGIDISNAALSTFRGNFDDAALSGLAAVPVVGALQPKLLRHVDKLANSTQAVLTSKLQKLDKFPIWKRFVSRINPVREHLDHGDELAELDKKFGFLRGVYYRTPFREYIEKLPLGETITYKLGLKGRMEYQQFRVIYHPKEVRASADSAKYQRDKRKVSKLIDLYGKPGDQLGHMTPDRNGGPMSIMNMVPQNRQANLAQRTVENAWNKYDNKRVVIVRVERIFNKGNNGGRPDAFRYPWSVDGRPMKPFFIPNDATAQPVHHAMEKLHEKLSQDDWVRLFALDAGISMAEIAIVTGDLSGSSDNAATHGIEPRPTVTPGSTVTTGQHKAIDPGTRRVELLIGEPYTGKCEEDRFCYWFDINLYDFGSGPYHVKCGTLYLPESKANDVDPLNREIWRIDPQVQFSRLDRTCKFWLDGNRVYVEVDGIRSNYLLWNPTQDTS